jgi:hypothetical protein
VTYGDVLGATDKLGSDPVMPEDAALMQSAKARTFGKTRKDGAAPVMQAAAEENGKARFVKEKQSAESEPELRVQLADEGVVQRGLLTRGVSRREEKS